MKTEKTNAVCFFVAVLLGGGICLFPSCNDEGGNRAPDKTLAAELSVSCRPFGSDSEALARSSDLRHRVVETVEIPLEDRWIVSATLEEEVVAPTRIAGLYDEINDGAKFMVVAYEKDGSNYVNPQSAEYVYVYDSGTGTGMLTKSGLPAIELTTGVTYRYVFYSYNSTAGVPAYGATISVTPNPGATTNNDLLWGESGDVLAGDPINVSLSHRFTRVKLKIGTAETATVPFSISSASFETNYSGVFTVEDGSFSSPTARTDQALLLTGTHISSSTSAESDYRLVHTGGQAGVRVKISGTIGNSAKPFSNLTPTFAGTLDAGRSYILRVRLRKGRAWAGSNIYWDENLYPDRAEGERGGLTFAPHGDQTKGHYQGVFFRWGSLVGVAPKGTPFDTGANDSPDSTIIYVYHDNQWRETSVATAYSRGYPGFTTLSSWSDCIPYSTAGCGNRTEDCLGSLVIDNTGDICRFIDPLYRMPNGSECQSGTYTAWADLAAYGWYLGSNFVTATSGQEDATGRRLVGIAAGTGGYATNYGSIFPGAGYFGSDGMGVGTNSGPSVGRYGHYWSSSADDTHSAHPMSLSTGSKSLGRTVKMTAYSVRCLLNE